MSQDFPRLAATLAHQRFGTSLRHAVEAFQRALPPGAQFLLLNGLLYPARELNLYSLLDGLRREVGGWIGAVGAVGCGLDMA